jgi:hypothetical protein
MVFTAQCSRDAAKKMLLHSAALHGYGYSPFDTRTDDEAKKLLLHGVARCKPPLDSAC